MTRCTYITRLVVLVSSVVCGLLIVSGHAADDIARARPNVLFVAIDDLRPSLGCYGDLTAKSPNIDALAATGRQFNRAYCQQAVCGPSRASLLTGRLPAITRVWHNRNRFRDALPSAVTLPQLFKNGGYHTQSLGKVFSGDQREEDSQSWSVPATLRRPGWENYVLPESRGKNKKGLAFEAGMVDDNGYTDGKLADLAVRTLEELKSADKPFFLAVGFFKPHLPFNAPKKYWDLYHPSAFDLKSGTAPIKNAPKIAYHSHRELGGYRKVPEDEALSADQTRKLRHGYYACVSYVDAQVGKLLTALQHLNLETNTIVVLWGDHGYALGEGKRWCKGTNFELDTHVPLIIRTPQMAQPGVTSEALTELVDIYPTLAELAGLSPPIDLDGRSLAANLRNPNATGRTAVLSQFPRPFRPTAPEMMGYSIRTNRHRYTRWIKWDSRRLIAEELYDYSELQNTVKHTGSLVERRNVVDDPTFDDVRNLLRVRMDQILSARTKTVDSTGSKPTPNAQTE